MHDGANAEVVDDAVDQHPLGDRAMEERHVVGHDLARAVRQIVDDGNAPAGILERKNSVAADIAGAAGDEDRDFLHRARLANGGRRR